MISLINTRSHWTDVIEQNHFPDGTLHINMPPNYFDYDTIVWEYENDAELFTLICVKENLGFSYDVLDNFLLNGITPPYEIYKNIEQRHKRNLHKISPMPTCPFFS